MKDRRAPSADPAAKVGGRAETRAPDGLAPVLEAAAPAGTAAVLRVQRLAGNRAAGVYVARITDEELAARGERAATETDRSRYDRAIAAADVGPLKEIVAWGPFSQAERIRALSMLSNQGWAGPRDEWAMESIWDSFGEGIRGVAEANFALWEGCIARGAELHSLGSVASLRAQFENDTKQRARDYMARNLASIHGEIEALGLEASAPNEAIRNDQDDRLAFVQQILVEVGRAQQLATALRRVPVGYDIIPNYSDMPSFGPDETVSHFDPNSQPGRASTEPGFAPWEQVKTKWDSVQSVITGYASMSPEVHLAIRDNRVDALAQASPAQARAEMATSLRETETKIRETQPKIDSGDLDWRDLQPIHGQLYAEQGRFYRTIGQGVIGDHEGMQTLLAIGGGLLAGALFVVAEVASGGLATAALIGGVATSGGMAARSWEQWEDLSVAARASASPETALVSQGQADAALIAAVLDTVFAFLDGFQSVTRGLALFTERGIGRAAANLRGAEALAELGRGVYRADAPEVLAHGIAELGVPEAMRVSGKNAEELLLLVGRDSPAGRQVLAYQELLAREGVEAGSREATAALSRSVRERVALIATGELEGDAARAAASDGLVALGPRGLLDASGGWTKLSSVIGNDADAGRALVAWREGLYQDLLAWAETGLKREGIPEGQPLLEATGSRGAFKNDLDISTYGTFASENRDLARRFLAERAGVGTGDLNRLLKNDFFTDAARMRAFNDVVPEALREDIARRVAASQNVMVLNAQLQMAEQAGDEAATAAIRAQMDAAGVPVRRVTVMTEAQASALSREVDSLQQRLVEACRSGDTAAQAQLAQSIVEHQTMINVAEQGGYFTSGGARRFVTERNLYEPAGGIGPIGPPLSAADRLSAVIDQIPKLNHAVHELHAATNVGELADAFRSIGKYGQRMSEVGFNGPADSVFADLASRFASIKSRADRGVIDEVLRADAEAALHGVTQQSTSLLTALRQEANLAHSATAVEAMSAQMANHARWLAYRSTIIRVLSGVGRAAVDGAASEATSSEPAPEPNMSVASP
jgi:hypothetical protein